MVLKALMLYETKYSVFKSCLLQFLPRLTASPRPSMGRKAYYQQQPSCIEPYKPAFDVGAILIISRTATIFMSNTSYVLGSKYAIL
ncbi:hypothetical protein GDO78_002723 [Eleutherodactylus coqui]|uniref:Uncharacterized protein n=1 Tax=Eleutherodactylus coqui TaxID=57060 RepID=A0A8J6EWV0_ELECQ|nr:hypothetical protein GDO78_002723 [Eleutherodactylus coqui]